MDCQTIKRRTRTKGNEIRATEAKIYFERGLSGRRTGGFSFKLSGSGWGTGRQRSPSAWSRAQSCCRLPLGLQLLGRGGVFWLGHCGNLGIVAVGAHVFGEHVQGQIAHGALLAARKCGQRFLQLGVAANSERVERRHADNVAQLSRIAKGFQKRLDECSLVAIVWHNTVHLWQERD